MLRAANASNAVGEEQSLDQTDSRDVIVFIVSSQPKPSLREHSLPHSLLPNTELVANIERSLEASSLSRGFDEEPNAPASIL